MSFEMAHLVLLVDDHDDTLEMYRIVLRAAGYRVMSASTGRDALAKAALQRPDVVITDIRMPGDISGLDLCRHFHCLGVPVIVLTGLTGHVTELEEIREAACAVRFLIKPVLPEKVADEVREVLNSPAAA